MSVKESKKKKGNAIKKKNLEEKPVFNEITFNVVVNLFTKNHKICI